MSRTKKIAILAIICMVLTLMPTALFAATADSDRLSGAGRIETALDIASAGWTTAGAVVLAPADQDNLVDALAAAPLAGQEDAPILLTFKGSLDAAVKAKITALGAKKVYVIGAISDAVANEVKALSGVTVEVLKGASRQATAAAVNAKLTSPAGTFVVGYDAVADALSVASFAAANKYAIVLANANGTVDASALKGTTTYIVGGPTLVADIAGATRMYGADRFETNSAVAGKLMFDYARVYVANGVSLVDALAVAPLAAKYDAFVALASSTDADAASVVNGKLTASSKVIAVGGTGVVSDAVKAKFGYQAPAGLAVTSVTAVNLNQIVVVFNKDVDETTAVDPDNYTLDGSDLVANDSVSLGADDKTVTIVLNAARDQYEKDVAFVVKKAIYSEDYLEKNIKFEGELDFSDVTVPKVKAVTTKGNKSITIEFTEAVAMDVIPTDDFEIDGQKLVNFGFTSTSVKGDPTAAESYSTKVEFKFDEAIDSGSHTLLIPEGTFEDWFADAAGFMGAETSVDFTISEKTTAPTVTKVEAQTSGTVYVTFSQAMDKVTAVDNFAANYEVAGNAPTGASFKDGSGDTIVKLSFAGGDVEKGANVLEINGDIKDAWGNKIEADEIVRVSFTATEDKTAPEVVSVTMPDNETIRIKFNEDVDSAFATNVNNYDLKNSDGENKDTMLVSPATMPDDDVVEIELTSAITSSGWTLKIKNIYDKAATPNKMDDYTATISGSDDVDPSVAEAVEYDSSTPKVTVYFSEAMSSNIGTKSNYAYGYTDGTVKYKALPSSATISVSADKKAVVITFPSAYSIDAAAAGTGEYNVQEIRVANVTDAAGNTLDGIVVSQDIIATAASALNPVVKDDTFKLYKSGSTVVAEVEYSRALSTLNKNDFEVEGATPDSAYLSGKKVIMKFTDATAKEDIKAAGIAAELVVTGTTTTDSTGVVVDSDTYVVYDDQLAPELLSDAGDIVVNADVAGAATIVLTFSEDLDDEIAGLYKNDFTFVNKDAGIALTVDSVQVLNDQIIFTMVQAIDAADDIEIRAKATVDVRDMEDDADNNNVYVPTTDDKAGYTVAAV